LRRAGRPARRRGGAPPAPRPGAGPPPPRASPGRPRRPPPAVPPPRRLARAAEAMDISPREHAVIAGDAQHLIARFSGNRPLLRMLEEMTGRALWRMAWSDPPLDLTTRARRQQSARFWSDLLAAIRSGDAAQAERTARLLLEASRDHMIAAMAALQPELTPEFSEGAD